jgi:hypothetical protein
MLLKVFFTERFSLIVVLMISETVSDECNIKDTLAREKEN